MIKKETLYWFGLVVLVEGGLKHWGGLGGDWTKGKRGR